MASCPTCGRPLEASDAPSARAAQTDSLRAVLHTLVDDVAWEGWLSEVEAIGMQDGALVVRVTDSYRAWVQGRYGAVLAEAASALAGHPVPVLVVDSQWRPVAEDG